MSREIKFKVWSKSDKSMLDVGHWTINMCNVSFQTNPVMQFSGLMDEEGKEIYEGDIMQDENGRNRIVVFDYGAFKVMWNNENPTQINLYPFNKHWLVIGNVFENPELCGE